MAKRFTYQDMLDFATEAWGPLGASTVQTWSVFNEKYFAGVLKPVPIVITHAQPFGGKLAFCSYYHYEQGRTITLNVPIDHDVLVADNATLLHEMVHQCLFERGEDAAHKSEGWRREIMRLHRLITKKEIWAGRSKTVRPPEDKKKVVRINEPHPDGRASLGQGEIARWPDFKLGKLGAVVRVSGVRRR